MIGVDDQEFFFFVVVDLVFVVFVEVFEVIEVYVVFVVLAVFLNVFYKGWNVGFEVNQQVWWLNLRRYSFEQVKVILEIVG